MVIGALARREWLASLGHEICGHRSGVLALARLLVVIMMFVVPMSLYLTPDVERIPLITPGGGSVIAWLVWMGLDTALVYLAQFRHFQLFYGGIWGSLF